jgi:hypothetical protein
MRHMMPRDRERQPVVGDTRKSAREGAARGGGPAGGDREGLSRAGRVQTAGYGDVHRGDEAATLLM